MTAEDGPGCGGAALVGGWAGWRGRRRILASEPRARALPTPSPLNCIKGFPIRQHVPRCPGKQTSGPSPTSENQDQHFTLATGQPHKRTNRTFHALSAGQPTLAHPTRRLLGTQAFATCPPAPSTSLGCITPPSPHRWGPSPSIAPRPDTTENHTRAMRRGEERAHSFRVPSPCSSPPPSAI